MTEPFEILVIQELQGLRAGQTKMLEAFTAHKEEVKQDFVNLALKSAEATGEAKAMAKLWSLGGAAFTTVFAGSYELLKHFFNWK